MPSKEEKNLVNLLPLSVRMNKLGFEMTLSHRENVGLLKGTVFGMLFMGTVVMFRQSPYALIGIGILCAVTLYQLYSVWKRADFFNSYKKDLLSVADEYEMYLMYSNLGSIVKTVQAEVSGETFIKGRLLTEQEVAGIVEAATKNIKDRPVALLKLNEASRLIDEALEMWIGRYPNHNLERMLETLDAIRSAEERRTMRIVIKDPKDAKET